MMAARYEPPPSLASDLADAGNERTSNKVGIAIGKGAGRPLNAKLSGGPDAKERAALWGRRTATNR